MKKENQIRYKNDLNKLSLGGFSERDLNFFMMCCARLKDSGGAEMTLDFADFQDVAGKHLTKEEALESILTVNDKQAKVTARVTDSEGCIHQGGMFHFVTNPKEETVRVSVHPDFLFLLDNVTDGGNFTLFELMEFIKIRGKYAKNLYRLLKQYRKSGWYDVTLETLKLLLDVPQSYTGKRVWDKVIKPAVEELSAYFPGLSCTGKYSRKRGNPLTGFQFQFIPEGRLIEQQGSSEKKQLTQAQKTAIAHKAAGDYRPGKRNSFNNFKGRDTDYDEITRLIIAKQDEEA